jgi:endonuclease/exonuclease/phosphatase (EEP) superfamily protein YafD
MVPVDRGSDSRKPSILRERLARLGLALCALLAFATACAALARFWWIFELFVHFRVQYAAAGLLLGAALWALRWRLSAATALALAMVNLAYVATLFSPHAADAESPTSVPLHVVALNVLGYNRDYDRVLEYLQRERPDVVVLTEVTPGWADALQAIESEYAFRWVHAGDLRSGIAVLSRQRPTATREIDLAGTGHPSMLLALDTPGGPISLLGTHLFWPMGADVAAVRDRQLERLAAIARQQVPLVIAGDLNTTQFSPRFHDLLHDGALANCAAGRGFTPTWPTFVPVLLIQIDHCLATRGVRVSGFHTGEYVGSDHYPIAFDVRAARAANP